MFERLKPLHLLRNAQGCWRRGFHTTSAVASTSTSDLHRTAIAKTRNIGIIAHIDAGKTTTTERMLFYSGTTKRIGNVDQGDTVTDYLPAERDRGITIQSAAITIPWNGNKINIIDTPGHADFTFEVIRSLRVLDGAVTILDAVAGVEAQTEKVWKQATDLRIPKIIYINKMDREGAGFSRTVKEVVSKLGTKILLVNVPYFIEDPVTRERKFHGVIDVFEKKLLKWDNTDPDGRKVEIIDISNESDTPELYLECYKCLEAVIETLGEHDEKLIEAFFETEDYMKVPVSIIKNAVKTAALSGFAVPVLCGSSFRNIGVQPLLDAVVNYLPSPAEAVLPEVEQNSHLISKNKKKNNKVVHLEEVPVKIDNNLGLIINNNNNLTLSLAFKVITHPIRGVMVFVRIYSGKLHAGSTVINTRTGEKLKISKLLLMYADVPEDVATLSAGNIGVITGTEDIITGDTLVSHSMKKDGSNSFKETEKALTLHSINIPPPVFSVALEPRTLGDRRQMEESLKILLREDPSLKLTVDDESGQTLLSGMGELHLEIATDRLVKDLKSKVEVGKVVVTYKESLVSATSSATKSMEIKTTNGSGVCSITLTMDSFEGIAEESQFAEEDGAISVHDNNIIIIEEDAMPDVVKAALSGEVPWHFPFTYQSLNKSLISGATAALQIGGPMNRLPLHSTVIRISKYDIPFETVSTSGLLTATRFCINDLIKSSDKNKFTILEPHMKVSVYVNGDDVGSVIQDLTSVRGASISSIDDASESFDGSNWSKEEAEKVYLPEDPTIGYTKLASTNLGKKIVRAEAPLREMIGYLSKLRSLTQGRGIFDMEYLKMSRTTKDRIEVILND